MVGASKAHGARSELLFFLPKGQRGWVTVRVANPYGEEKKVPLHPTFSAGFGLSEASDLRQSCSGGGGGACDVRCAKLSTFFF